MNCLRGQVKTISFMISIADISYYLNAFSKWNVQEKSNKNIFYYGAYYIYT